LIPEPYGCDTDRMDVRSPAPHHGAMGRRPSFDHWHRERLDLRDGDVLTWTRIDTPPPVWVDAFRLASRGAIGPAEGLALLAAAGHPDAESLLAGPFH
jgi:hypothetical protein